MSIIKRVTHPASLSFVNLILALGSVPTVALSSSTRKSRIMISVGICSCQCTIIPEWVINLGGITDQFARNKCSTSPVSLSTKNGIFRFLPAFTNRRRLRTCILIITNLVDRNMISAIWFRRSAHCHANPSLSSIEYTRV